MKTKLLAIMMMGLATFGSLGGLAMANNNPTGVSEFKAGGFAVEGNAGASNAKDIGVSWAGADTGDSLITTIKTFINWVLGLLALITLCLLLWGGFQMVTAAGDDAKYKKGFTILKQAGIWLAFIALSWFMVSIIFWVIWGSGAKGGTDIQKS